MGKVTLVRTETSDEGTFGELTTESGFECKTGELPWRDNAPGKSCIPEGTYAVTWRFSEKHGYCYHVENVPGRTDIEIHSANFMGDVDERYKCELSGCIAPGRNIGVITKQKSIVASRIALADLEVDLEKEPFTLSISWGVGGDGPRPLTGEAS